MANVYFDLTREFNSNGTVVLLSSGQAVVWYRLAIMSKDGDWIVREDAGSCARVLAVLAAHGARQRPSAPLDPRWLAGGWSSHFEFLDAQQRRVRCDFVSRPPRVSTAAIAALFAQPWPLAELPVIDLPSLIATKRTQRAKDYSVIGELAGRLPSAEEAACTTNVDRILELARDVTGVDREAIRLAQRGATREQVVVALAKEVDAMQRADRERIERYVRAAERYYREFHVQGLERLPLAEAHQRAVRLADSMLPAQV
ncbi:MAG TPA: hypothetical protein VK348_10240 [Planctomycetota bacterium]|nr:hypothetical protein [Planctomycetota bacterium]